jgi:hypothetical protein
MLGLLGWLFYTLQAKVEPALLWQSFTYKMADADVTWLYLALLFMPLNWLAEIEKWRPLVVPYENISYRNAARAVLMGATFSLFSPNRLGEYGGRVLFISPANQWKALMAHVAGGLVQLIVLLLFGSIGGLYGLKLLWGINHAWMWVLVLTIDALLLFFYFRIGTVMALVKRISWLHPFKRYVKSVNVLEYLKGQSGWKLLGWSAFRYIVSCSQYYFLLQFFDIRVGLLGGFSCISGIFLLQTCIPLPPVVGFLARSNIAVFVWANFGANEYSSLACSISLWIINLFLPALMGTFSILYVNIYKTLGYENK